MSTRWVPPYFGSWEDLVRAVLQNPFLGSGTTPFHQTHLFQTHPTGTESVESLLRNPALASALNPQPLPPREAVAAMLVFQIGLRDLASRLPREQGSELNSRLNQMIEDEIDDICGTPPNIHWPIPGPPPFALVVATELNLIANAMQEGTIREGVLEIANRIMQKATATSARKESKAAA
jgi:hypothetical protein